MYITQDMYKGFNGYKYNSLDTSPLSKYVMHPFWNQFIKLFPLWVAPNVMTFGGFLLIQLQFVLLLCYDPYYSVVTNNLPIPVWVWVYSAFAQFLSHSLDGIDGKQARRTGTSSPLGELFDHGLDSWSCSLYLFNIYTLYGQHEMPVNDMMQILALSLFCFFLSHWEKYVTGLLYLPWSYDFSQLYLAFVYTISVIYGYEFMQKKIFGYSLVFYSKLLFYACSFTFSIPLSLYNVYVARQNSTGRSLSMYDIILPWFSPVLCTIIYVCWAVWSPSNVLHINARLFMFAFGVVYSNIICRVIVAQMSDSKCQLLNPLVVLSAVSMASALFTNHAAFELPILWLNTAVLTLAHIHYAVVVV